MRFNILPFVQRDESGRALSTWHVTETGDYLRDCQLGREYFSLLRSAMRRDNNPALLGQVMRDQIKAGKWGGIEIGFHAALAEIAI